MSDIFFSVAGAAMALFFLAMAISWIKDSISDALDRKVKRRELKEKEFAKINEENLSLREEKSELLKKISELEEKLKERSQATWRDQYYKLQELYYNMYLEYTGNSSAGCAEDLFPIDEERLSSTELRYELNREKVRNRELDGSLKVHKGEILEANREIEALNTQIYDLESEITDLLSYKLKFNELQHSLPLSHLIGCRGSEAYSDALDSKKGNKAVSGDIVVQEVFWGENPGRTPPKQICANIYSKTSGKTYRTTLTTCSCPNHQTNASKDKYYVCKHMLALALTLKVIPIDFK